MKTFDILKKEVRKKRGEGIVPQLWHEKGKSVKGGARVPDCKKRKGLPI